MFVLPKANVYVVAFTNTDGVYSEALLDTFLDIVTNDGDTAVSRFPRIKSLISYLISFFK